MLLPDQATDTGPFAWLSYDGQWGQKEKGFNNGPTGPQAKTQWNEPFSWMADQRSSSLRMPGGALVGPQVAEAFCGVVAFGSEIVNTDARSRPLAIATLVVLAVLLGLFVGLTRWRPVELTPLRARRSFGQLIRAARQLYGRHWRVLVPIALTAIPIVGGTNRLAALLGGETSIQIGGDTGILGTIGDLIALLGNPAASAIVAAVAVVFVRLLVETGRAGFVDSWRGMTQRFWRVVLAQLGATLGVTLLAISIIGLPWAIWKLVGWRFVQQEVLFTDKSIREAFRGSSELVRGRWWSTLRTALFLTLVTVVTGPGAHDRALLHEPAADLDHHHRRGDLRAADPVRRDRQHAALLRPGGAGRHRTGRAAAVLAPLAAPAVRPPGHRRPRPPRAEHLAPRGAHHPNRSGREDLNLRPPGPQPGALPGCATPRETEAYRIIRGSRRRPGAGSAPRRTPRPCG